MFVIKLFSVLTWLVANLVWQGKDWGHTILSLQRAATTSLQLIPFSALQVAFNFKHCKSFFLFVFFLQKIIGFIHNFYTPQNMASSGVLCNLGPTVLNISKLKIEPKPNHKRTESLSIFWRYFLTLHIV